MRRNSNYFGDLSQFFLRAKKEENFMLDAKIKNELREKLSLKINEIKNPQTQTQTENISAIVNEPDENNGSFWTLWRRQLISIPASLFALVMIVFAANNFNFTMQSPKNAEDFSPKTEKTSDLQTSLLDTTKPELTEDSALIAEALPEETKTQPELLILDINSMGQNSSGEIRTLNKYEQTSTTSQESQKTTTTGQTQTTQTQTPTTTPTQKTTNTVTPNQQVASVKITTTESSKNQQIKNELPTNTVNTQTQTTPQITQSDSIPVESIQLSDQPDEVPQLALTNTQTGEIITGANSNINNQYLITNLAENNNTAAVTNLPEAHVVAPQETIAETTTLNKPINDNAITAVNSGILIVTAESVPLTSYIKSSDIFVETLKTGEYSINYYKNSTSKTEPIFDKSIITEITSNKTPTAVNVYYISKTQVLVEVIEGTTKKLYLYENKDGSWTVIKYEKK